MSTLFSKIISGEIPSYKLYEDEYTYAFLDIFPQTPGHTLIVPKIEIDHFSDVPEPYYSAIFLTAKKLSKAVEKATGCKRVCTTFLGYEVPHAHYHLIPTMNIGDIHRKPEKASDEELREMQANIIIHLGA